MDNLRKFETEAEYSAATLNFPAVSWVTATDNVHFDKEEPTPPTPTFSGLTVYYNIESVGEYELFNGGGSGSGSGSGGVLPSAMIVDGTEVEVTATYQFDTVGEHIVNYSFEDNQIPNYYLDSTGDRFPHLVGIEIGNAITSIGDWAFLTCNGLTSCTIGSGVTSIGTEAFNGCSGLTSITVNATTPPELGSIAFYDTNNCPIYVPSGSVNAYQSAWSDYASRIQAIS